MGGCNVVAILSMAAMSCLYAETVEWMSRAGSVWYVGIRLYCEIFAAEQGRYGLMEDCGVSNAEYLVHCV